MAGTSGGRALKMSQVFGGVDAHKGLSARWRRCHQVKVGTETQVVNASACRIYSLRPLGVAGFGVLGGSQGFDQDQHVGMSTAR